MPDQYLSQIEAFAFGFAPVGWLPCEGQLLPINQNQALFSLIGTYYGGDGRTNFALPDLRGRAALGMGQGARSSSYPLGQHGGEEAHTLLGTETPAHTHPVHAWANPVTSATNTPSPAVQPSSATSTQVPPLPENIYGAPATGTLAADAVSTVGGSPHENRMPFLALTYCMAVQGIYPSRA